MTTNKMVKVKLLKDHAHDGREFKAGNVIELPQDVADFLIDLRDGEGKPSPGAKLVTEAPAEKAATALAGAAKN